VFWPKSASAPLIKARGSAKCFSRGVDVNLAQVMAVDRLSGQALTRISPRRFSAGHDAPIPIGMPAAPV
jgi:hypothetical protein